MPIGVRDSYGTDALPKDYVGNALQNVEDNAFRVRQERRLEDQIKAKRREEDEKALAEHLKNFKVDLTGYKSFDDLGQGTAQEYFNAYADTARKLQNTTDRNERLKLKTEQARLDQNIFALKQIPGFLKDKAEFIAKNIDHLNPDDVDIIQRQMKALDNGNAKVYLDENKVPHINVYDVDKDGKITGLLVKEQPLAEYINSINPHGKSNYQDIIQDAIKNTGYKTTASQNGAYTYDNKIVPDDVKNRTAESVAQLVYSNPNERYVMAKRLGVSEDDEKAIKTAVMNDYKSGLDEVHKQGIDTGYLNYRLAKKKDEKDEIKVNSIVFDNTRRDDFLPDDAKGKYVGASTVLKNGLGFSKPVKVLNIGGELSGLNGAEVLGVTKDKATGDYVFTGRALIDKGKKFKAPNGELIGLMELQSKLKDPSIPDSEKYNLQAQLDSYSTGANYGNFVRRITNEDNVNQILSAVGYDLNKADSELARLNPNASKSNIPTYSKSDLKTNGWSDSQINEAVRLGKIKVN
jgi:hypothetical protein